MLESMTCSQFFRWLEFYNHEPFGFHQENLRSGLNAYSSLLAGGVEIKGSKIGLEQIMKWMSPDVSMVETKNKEAIVSDRQWESWICSLKGDLGI